MKTFIRKQAQAIKFSFITFCLLLLTSVQLFAQNVSDSDLSNSAGTNKNWFGSIWLFGVIAILIIVLLIAFNRRKTRDRSKTSR
jgi:TRAP-type C4-dicarboxylate transport system permease small subunit